MHIVLIFLLVFILPSCAKTQAEKRVFIKENLRKTVELLEDDYNKLIIPNVVKNYEQDVK